MQPPRELLSRLFCPAAFHLGARSSSIWSPLQSPTGATQFHMHTRKTKVDKRCRKRKVLLVLTCNAWACNAVPSTSGSACATSTLISNSNGDSSHRLASCTPKVGFFAPELAQEALYGVFASPDVGLRQQEPYMHAHRRHESEQPMNTCIYLGLAHAPCSLPYTSPRIE